METLCGIVGDYAVYIAEYGLRVYKSNKDGRDLINPTQGFDGQFRYTLVIDGKLVVLTSARVYLRAFGSELPGGELAVGILESGLSAHTDGFLRQLAIDMGVAGKILAAYESGVDSRYLGELYGVSHMSIIRLIKSLQGEKSALESE